MIQPPLPTPAAAPPPSPLPCAPDAGRTVVVAFPAELAEALIINTRQYLLAAAAAGHIQERRP